MERLIESRLPNVPSILGEKNILFQLVVLRRVNGGFVFFGQSFKFLTGIC